MTTVVLVMTGATSMVTLTPMADAIELALTVWAVLNTEAASTSTVESLLALDGITMLISKIP